ncbi:MAG: MATE family efflux transporter [Proteobacteria bacterium]|nr:MATE family efflux transporter [Pseudomonadota bacterium]
MITHQEVNKKIMRLALPMAATQLMTNGSAFLCMAMLAKLGHDVLAASALIYSISLSAILSGASLLFSLSILVGHAYGAKEYLNIGSLMQHAWLFALLMSVPFILFFWNIYPILIFFKQDPTIAHIVQEFFRAYIWRVAPIFLAICNQQFLYGTHKQKIDLFANILGIIVLLTSSYLLIFGKWGFPKLGVAGLAYAIAIQAWFYLFFTTACMRFIDDFKCFSLFHNRLNQNWDSLRRLFKIGWPISLQISGELLSFLVGSIFIGWLGTNPLAAYQVITQYNFLIVIPIFAIAQASGILIGQAYGSKNFFEIRKLGQASVRVTTIIGTMAGLIFICFPKILSIPYLDIHNPANQEVLHLIVVLFIVLAFAQCLDGIRNTLIGSLRGLLDTRAPMIIGLLTIWLIGIPLGYLLGFSFHLGAVGVMLGWTIGMLTGAVILAYRWHNMTLKFMTH